MSGTSSKNGTRGERAVRVPRWMLLAGVMVLMAGLVGALGFLRSRPIASDEDFRRAAVAMDALHRVTDCTDSPGDRAPALRELLDPEGPWRACHGIERVTPENEMFFRSSVAADELRCYVGLDPDCHRGLRPIGEVAGPAERQVLEHCAAFVARADQIALLEAHCAAFPLGETRPSDLTPLNMLVDVELVFARDRVRTGQPNEAIARLTAALSFLTGLLEHTPDLVAYWQTMEAVSDVVRQVAAILESPIELDPAALTQREAEVLLLAERMSDPAETVALNALAELPDDPIPGAATTAGDVDGLVWAIGFEGRFSELTCDGTDDAVCARACELARTESVHQVVPSWSELALSPRLLDARARYRVDDDSSVNTLAQALWTRGLLYGLALALAHRRLSVDGCASDAALLAERGSYALELTHPAPGETLITMPSWWPTSLESPALIRLVCPRVAAAIDG